MTTARSAANGHFALAELFIERAAERSGQLDPQSPAAQSVGVLIGSPPFIAGKLPWSFGNSFPLGRNMAQIDFDVIEEDLDLEVPSIYRMFIDAVNAKRYDLSRFGIYDDTEAVLKGNWKLRMDLADSTPKWKNEYFDFGVGDGCGNYFFLDGTDAQNDQVRLWAHDPPGIEDAGIGTEFFSALFAEIEAGFSGPNKYRFQGIGPLSAPGRKRT